MSYCIILLPFSGLFQPTQTNVPHVARIHEAPSRKKCYCHLRACFDPLLSCNPCLLLQLMHYLRIFALLSFSLLNYSSFVPNYLSTIHLHLTSCMVRQPRAGLQPDANRQRRVTDGGKGGLSSPSHMPPLYNNSSWVPTYHNLSDDLGYAHGPCAPLNVACNRLFKKIQGMHRVKRQL